MKKHHKFSKTTIEHHHDGTHTIEHHHETDPSKNVKSAAGSHDMMMDHLMDHTSAPNPGEGHDEHGQPLAAAPAMAPAAPAAGV